MGGGCYLLLKDVVVGGVIFCVRFFIVRFGKELYCCRDCFRVNIVDFIFFFFGRDRMVYVFI